jgi:cytochrome oxidase Cu insertion factor (SCO1/SenC/PrrC family)
VTEAAATVSAAEVALQIDAIRRESGAGRRLAEMLPEESRIYAGRGSSEAERLRGYILASFEATDLPSGAAPFVLEELESGRNPYTVAAAGRALRGASAIPDDAPELLVAAIARLRGRDEVVTFDRFAPGPPVGNGATSLYDLASTLVVLGPRASSALPALKALVEAEGTSFSPPVSAQLAKAMEALCVAESHVPACCCHEPGVTESGSADRAPASVAPLGVAEIALENQDGVQLSFSEAFLGRPTALAFFYTRCMNPEKCSRTVTRLGRLARLLERVAFDANVAGISYDPGFDRPRRLRTYGVDRGVVFTPRCSLLRTVGQFEPLMTAFRLGVGFGSTTVNQHRVDLVVLDSSLRLAERFERRLWRENSVLDALRLTGASGG